MRFHGLDLNLLVALDALLTHQNVTRAAEQLNLSQSALSGALARLREHFDDELVVPIGRRMEPTPLARTLAEPLHEILLKTKSLVTATPTFDPQTSNRRISIIASDYSTEIFMLDLVTGLAREAPGIKIALEEHTTETFEKFNRGEINLRIIPKCFAFDGHPNERLFDEKYVCVAWKGNKQIGELLTLRTVSKSAACSEVFQGRPADDFRSAVSRSGRLFPQRVRHRTRLLAGAATRRWHATHCDGTCAARGAVCAYACRSGYWRRR